MEIGFALSSEDNDADALVRQAVRAEQAGFDFALVSDHYHPWTRRQGQSPFVWCVLGAIAGATERLRIGTGVTCPTIRIHPAIIAQAAATAASMLPGRFLLGLGSGENLNEHVLGDRWPPTDVRHAMLEEAVEVIRLLWRGEQCSHHGRFYTVENARIYTLPEESPPILVAAAGPKAASLAGRIGNGLIATSPDPGILDPYGRTAGPGPPRYGGLTVSWAAAGTAEARRQAHALWPVTALAGELGQELPTPAHFEQATASLTEEEVAQAVVCSPDPERHVAAIEEYREAGFDHVYVHQVARDQVGLVEFYGQEVLPRLT